MKRAVGLVLSNPLLLVGGLLLLFIVPKLFFSKNSLGDLPVDMPRDDERSTIDDSTANWIADSLEAAMEVFTGTDEKRIYDLLANLSLADFNKVYNAFGLKYYSQTFGEGGVPWLTDRLDLIGWLKSELNGKEVERLKIVNPHLPL